MKIQPDSPREFGSQAPAKGDRTRPVDAIIVGQTPSGVARSSCSWVAETWVLAAPPDEKIADFFLEDEGWPRGAEADPVTWVCRRVGTDGSIVLGSVNLRNDHFLSEIFSVDEDG